MITGFPSLETAIQALKIGADDYITKPFSPGELVARVNAHLENYARLKSKFSMDSKKSNTLTIRGLRIEKAARRVLSMIKKLALLRRNSNLLNFFAQNPNRVFVGKNYSNGFGGWIL